jgi:hypothetical protein
MSQTTSAGYQQFIEAGKKLKKSSKNAGNRSSCSNIKSSIYTSVNRANKQPTLSIEGKAIEEKDIAIKLEHYKRISKKAVIINNSAYLDKKGKLQLPDSVTSLIDNPVFMPRYMKLAKTHGVEYLIKLAELARQENHYRPSHWFARCCSVKQWSEQTFEMLKDLFKRLEDLKHKLHGIGVKSEWIPYYLKAMKKLPEGRFMAALELARARHVDKPPNMLAKVIKDALNPQETSKVAQ